VRGAPRLTVKVDVDTVESDQEVGEDILLSLGNVGKESGDELLSAGEGLVDLDKELESLGVDVSDLDTTLVGEQDPVTLSGRVDADVVLGVGRVRGEGLNDEGVKGTGGLLDSDGLSSSLLDPSASGLPLLVEREQTSLSSSLDQLVGLSDELLGEDPVGETLTGSDGGSELLGDRVPGTLAGVRLARLGWLMFGTIAHHSTWATRTAAAEVEVTVGMGVGDRFNQ
jgi:hypothetical protein